MTSIWEIKDDEYLYRNVYEKFHVKKGKLHWKAFEPPAVPPDRLRSNEISTLRPKFAIEEFVTYLGRQYSKGRYYAGFFRISSNNINKRHPKMWVDSTPFGDVDLKVCLCSHADIRCDYPSEQEKAVPPEFLQILKELSREAELCYYGA